VRWLLIKLAFFYPRVFAFSSYRRKKEKRREYEDKVIFFYQKEKDPEIVKRIVKGVFELRGVRKVMRYLIPLMDASGWGIERGKRGCSDCRPYWNSPSFL
jgi:hypothetical protein